MAFVCWDFIELVIDGIFFIDVVSVRGAILTCFFGSTLAYDFFIAFDLREIGDTLAVFRSIFLFNTLVVVVVVVVVSTAETATAAIEIPPFDAFDKGNDDNDDDVDGNVSTFVDIPFNGVAFVSSFCCEDK